MYYKPLSKSCPVCDVVSLISFRDDKCKTLGRILGINSWQILSVLPEIWNWFWEMASKNTHQKQRITLFDAIQSLHNKSCGKWLFWDILCVCGRSVTFPIQKHSFVLLFWYINRCTTYYREADMYFWDLTTFILTACHIYQCKRRQILQFGGFCPFWNNLI